jgi:hypothetical protein
VTDRTKTTDSPHLESCLLLLQPALDVDFNTHPPPAHHSSRQFLPPGQAEPLLSTKSSCRESGERHLHVTRSDSSSDSPPLPVCVSECVSVSVYREPSCPVCGAVLCCAVPCVDIVPCVGLFLHPALRLLLLLSLLSGRTSSRRRLSGSSKGPRLYRYHLSFWEAQSVKPYKPTKQQPPPNHLTNYPNEPTTRTFKCCRSGKRYL